MRQASSPSRPRPPKPKPKLSPNKHATPPAATDPSPAGPAGPAVPPAALPVPANPDPADDKITTPARPRPPVVLPNPAEPWKHPDELEYIRPYELSQVYLIKYLLDNVFTVPPRHPPGSVDPWCVVVGGDGTPTTIPKGYRLPLMFAMKFQWESLRLVLSSPQREVEWGDYKFDILHVARLCTIFLQRAREAMANNTLDKTWRCPMFDRALTRYYRRWLVNREEFLMGFWKEFEETEYEEDVLKKDWTRFVLKGHKGFHLTKEECAEGLSYKTLTAGLKYRPDDYQERYDWEPVRLPSPPAASLEPETPKGKRSRKMTGKRKRSGDKEKDKGEEEGGKDKVGTKGPLPMIHGWKGAQGSPTRKVKRPIVQPGETESTPPPKKARVEEVKEKEKEKVIVAASSSLAGEGESLELSQVSSRAVVEGEDVEGASAKKVEKDKDKEKEKAGDEQEHSGRFMENEGIHDESITSLPIVEGVEHVQCPRTSDDGGDGKTEMGGKGMEEKEKDEVNGGIDEDEDEVDLVAEGLMYPQSSSGSMEVDSQVLRDAVDEVEDNGNGNNNKNENENEKDEDEQNNGGASTAELPVAVVMTIDSVPAHDENENANENQREEDQNNGAVSTAGPPDPGSVPAPTAAPPIDSVSISNTTAIASSTAAPALMTSTNASGSTSSVAATKITITNTIMNTNTQLTPEPTTEPTTIPLSPLPASALPHTPPSHLNLTPPDTPLSNSPSRLNANINSRTKGMLNAGVSSDAGVSPSPSADKDQLPFFAPPSSSPSTSAAAAAVVVEGLSKSAAKHGGISLVNKQSGERATTMKGSGPVMETVTGVGGGVWVPPTETWYVPQIPQSDAKERERALQSANAARATSTVGSPGIPAVARFLSPALSSRPSNSNSVSGSASGSGVLSVSANPSPMLSPAPSVVETAPAPVPPPQPPVPANPSLTTIAVSLLPVTETVSDDREAESLGGSNSGTTTGPMDVDPAPRVKSSTSASDPAPLISEVDAPSESPVPLSPAQRLSRSALRSVSSAPSPSAERKKSRARIPRPNSRPTAREFPPLPGPSLPGPSATFEEYQLAAAAWSGSGSGSPDQGNDVNSHEPEGMREHVVSEHQHDHERDLQHNGADHRYERATYYDGYHRHSTTPGFPPHRPYHPYAYRPPSRPQYYSFVPPYYPPTPYNDYPPYLPSSVSAPYRPLRNSVNGSLSEMQSPVPPDTDPEDVEVDGNQVATRIVSIVQDMMVKLTDALSASGSVGEYGVGGERRRQRSSGDSVSGSVSADANTSRCNYAQSERAGGGESLKLEDVLGEIQLLKEDHRCEVSKMRNEIEGLRRQVQDLEERSMREQGTAEAMEIVGSDSEVTVANGVAVESSSSYPIDFTAEARDKSSPVNRFVSLVTEDILHRSDTPTTTNVGEDNSSFVLRQEEGVSVSEVDKGKRKEKVLCPPRIGATSSNDGIQMSPGHNGLPLPIKSQRKGRMFAIDMADNN